MINTNLRLDVHQENPEAVQHKEALAKYLADGNKVTVCVDTKSPRKRRTPVHCQGSKEFIPVVRGRYAQAKESGYTK